MNEPTTVSFAEALESGLITTYESATDEQVAIARDALTYLASDSVDVASFTESADHRTLNLFLVTLLGDGYDVSITRR